MKPGVLLAAVVALCLLGCGQSDPSDANLEAAKQRYEKLEKAAKAANGSWEAMPPEDKQLFLDDTGNEDLAKDLCANLASGKIPEPRARM